MLRVSNLNIDKIAPGGLITIENVQKTDRFVCPLCLAMFAQSKLREHVQDCMFKEANDNLNIIT